MIYKLFPAEFGYLRKSSSLREFGDCRSARHGRNATFGTKADLRNSVLNGTDGKFENISANRILLSDDHIGIFHLPGVSGVLEMIEKAF